MIPFSLAGRTRYRPYGTFALIVLSFAFFLWEIVVTYQAGMPFAEIVSDYALETCAVGQASFLEILTDGTRSLFLTPSFTQLLFNLIFLWIFAPRVEAYMGARRFFFFFIAVGFGGHIASILANPGNCLTLFGPNGAIAGTLAAFIFLYPFQKVDVFIGILSRRFEFPALFFIFIYLGVQVLAPEGGPLSGHLAPYWDEVGGFFSGLLIIFIATMFKPAPKPNPFKHLDD